MINKSLQAILKETFEKVDGIYLDGGSSLNETLAGISVIEASKPILNGTTIVSQVDHLLFYIEILSRYMEGEKLEKIDWMGSWKRKSISEEEWNILRSEVITRYKKLASYINGISDWGNKLMFEGALAILVHTAYHLGAIRQISHLAKINKDK